MPRTIRYCRAKSAPVETLLEFLCRRFPYLTEEQWRHHISDGHLRLNDAAVEDAGRCLKQADVICFAPPRSLEPPIDDIHLQILYEDADLIAVAKNGNIPVTEGGRYCENTLVAVLQRNGTLRYCCGGSATSGAAAPEKTMPLSCSGDAAVLKRRRSMVSSEWTAKSGMALCSHGGDAASADVVIAQPVACVERRGQRTRGGHCNGDAESASVPASAAASSIFPVHRLDKETSGVLVLAKSATAAKAVAQQFESQSLHCTKTVEELLASMMEEDSSTVGANGMTATPSLTASAFGVVTEENFTQLLSSCDKKVVKKYTAMLSGVAPLNHTFIVTSYMDPVASHPQLQHHRAHQKLKKLKMASLSLFEWRGLNKDAGKEAASSLLPASVAVRRRPWGKVACSRIRVIATDAYLGMSLVSVDILTGRSHQIRVHCADIGFPVLGDKLYTSMTPGLAGGSMAVDDDVYLTRVRNEEDPFLLVAPSLSLGDGTSRGPLSVRRHLLHAFRLSLAHPSRSHSEGNSVLNCIASPLDYFLQDVRCVNAEDQQAFASFLSSSCDALSAGEW